MSKITFVNKQSAVDPENPSIPTEVGRAEDWNEVKTVVNANADQIGSYKSYVALLNFDGTTFTTSILNNTLGNVVWSTPANGQIRATLAGVFINNKTIGFCTSPAAGYIVSFGRQSDDFVRFIFTNHDGTTTSTPNLTSASIEIRVYD